MPTHAVVDIILKYKLAVSWVNLFFTILIVLPNGSIDQLFLWQQWNSYDSSYDSGMNQSVTKVQ